MTRIYCDICGKYFRKGKTFHEHLKKSKCTRISVLMTALHEDSGLEINNPDKENKDDNNHDPHPVVRITNVKQELDTPARNKNQLTYKETAEFDRSYVKQEPDDEIDGSPFEGDVNRSGPTSSDIQNDVSTSHQSVLFTDTKNPTVSSSVTNHESQSYSDSESDMSDTGYQEIKVTADGDIILSDLDYSGSDWSDDVDWDLLESQGEVERFSVTQSSHTNLGNEATNGKKETHLQGEYSPNAAETCKILKRPKQGQTITPMNDVNVTREQDKNDLSTANNRKRKWKGKGQTRQSKRSKLDCTTNDVLIETDYSSSDDDNNLDFRRTRGTKNFNDFLTRINSNKRGLNSKTQQRDSKALSLPNNKRKEQNKNTSTSIITTDSESESETNQSFRLKTRSRLQRKSMKQTTINKYFHRDKDGVETLETDSIKKRTRSNSNNSNVLRKAQKKEVSPTNSTSDANDDSDCASVDNHRGAVIPNDTKQRGRGRPRRIHSVEKQKIGKELVDQIRKRLHDSINTGILDKGLNRGNNTRRKKNSPKEVGSPQETQEITAVSESESEHGESVNAKDSDDNKSPEQVDSPQDTQEIPDVSESDSGESADDNDDSDFNIADVELSTDSESDSELHSSDLSGPSSTHLNKNTKSILRDMLSGNIEYSSFKDMLWKPREKCIIPPQKTKTKRMDKEKKYRVQMNEYTQAQLKEKLRQILERSGPKKVNKKTRKVLNNWLTTFPENSHKKELADDNSEFICGICSKVFNSDSQVKDHMKVHLDDSVNITREEEGNVSAIHGSSGGEVLSSNSSGQDMCETQAPQTHIPDDRGMGQLITGVNKLENGANQLLSGEKQMTIKDTQLTNIDRPVAIDRQVSYSDVSIADKGEHVGHQFICGWCKEKFPDSSSLVKHLYTHTVTSENNSDSYLIVPSFSVEDSVLNTSTSPVRDSEQINHNIPDSTNTVTSPDIHRHEYTLGENTDDASNTGVTTKTMTATSSVDLSSQTTEKNQLSASIDNAKKPLDESLSSLIAKETNPDSNTIIIVSPTSLSNKNIVPVTNIPSVPSDKGKTDVSAIGTIAQRIDRVINKNDMLLQKGKVNNAPRTVVRESVNVNRQDSGKTLTDKAYTAIKPQIHVNNSNNVNRLVLGQTVIDKVHTAIKPQIHVNNSNNVNRPVLEQPVMDKDHTYIKRQTHVKDSNNVNTLVIGQPIKPQTHVNQLQGSTSTKTADKVEEKAVDPVELEKKKMEKKKSTISKLMKYKPSFLKF